MGKNRKLLIVIGIIAAIVIVGVFSYYSIMSNRASKIDGLNGQSYAAVKHAAEENGFSLSTVSTDQKLLNTLKHKSTWTATKISSDPWKRSTKVAIIPSPEAVTRAFLDGIKSDDHEMIKAAYEGDDFNIKEVAFIVSEDSDASDDSLDWQAEVREESLYPRLMDFDYEIADIKTDGDKATVTIDLTGYNIGAMYGKSISDFFDEAYKMAFAGASNEQLQALLVSKVRTNLETLTTKEYKKSTDIQLIKDENTWLVKTINREDEVTNVLTCGLRNATDDINNSY